MKLRRVSLSIFLTGLVLTCIVGSGYAQAPVQVPNVQVQAPATGGGAMIVRPLWTEIFITIVMFGLALFAVGRSSNRS